MKNKLIFKQLILIIRAEHMIFKVNLWVLSLPLLPSSVRKFYFTITICISHQQLVWLHSFNQFLHKTCLFCCCSNMKSVSHRLVNAISRPSNRCILIKDSALFQSPVSAARYRLFQNKRSFFLGIPEQKHTPQVMKLIIEEKKRAQKRKHSKINTGIYVVN